MIDRDLVLVQIDQESFLRLRDELTALRQRIAELSVDAERYRKLVALKPVMKEWLDAALDAEHKP